MGKSLAVAVAVGLIVAVASCSNGPVTASQPTPTSATTLPAGALADEQLQAEHPQVDALAVETTRSSVRPDDSELLETEDGRLVSGQFLQEGAFLLQTQNLPRAAGETDDMAVGLGYSICDALDRGVAFATLVGNLTSSGYTSTQAGTWVGASVLLCPEHQVTVLRQAG